MAKELDRAGITTVHVCSITPISVTVGANRIVRSVAIPHPFGEPSASPEAERLIRRALVEKALDALTTPISSQRVFD